MTGPARLTVRGGGFGPLPVAYALVDADVYRRLAIHRWRFDSKDYVIRDVPLANGGRTSIALHREVLGLRPGDGLEGDHLNDNRLDNRRENLAARTPQEHWLRHSGGRCVRGLHDLTDPANTHSDGRCAPCHRTWRARRRRTPTPTPTFTADFAQVASRFLRSRC